VPPRDDRLLTPVVGRESPVLTIYGEVIWWGTSLTVKVEEMWFCPCLHAVTAYADRDVSLYYDTLPSCLVPHVSKLNMKDILNVHV
jgi:hypothetical protein